MHSNPDKQSINRGSSPESKITFIGLMEGLRDALGEMAFPLNSGVSDVATLVSTSALHLTLARTIVAALYKANGCQHLRSELTAAASLDTLGKLRNTLIQEPACDVDQVGFLDDLVDAAVPLLNIKGETLD